ncbi:hypothetical protein [Nocardia iowensis]|uniref:hypothetical protein n=1 Tax=Nocardia iowensis TaxID=204891 RepID=UPI001FE80B51|nr:hypothetical protein [Nocardia iowensis]
MGQWGRDRLAEIVANLRDRIAEAKANGWTGEVEGLQVNLNAARRQTSEPRTTPRTGCPRDPTVLEIDADPDRPHARVEAVGEPRPGIYPFWTDFAPLVPADEAE